MHGIIPHAVFVSLCTLFVTNATVTAADVVPWVQDLNTARQMAAARNQLILVHFFSNNCPPCRNLDVNVFSRPGFGHGLARNYVPLKVNVSVSPDLARQFGVDRWPMDVVIKASGEEMHRMVSPQDGNEYLRILNQIAWRASTAPAGMDPQLAVRGFKDDQPRSAVASISVSQYQLGQQAAPNGDGSDANAATSFSTMASNLPRGENLGPLQTASGMSFGPAISQANVDVSNPQPSFSSQIDADAQPRVIQNRYAQPAVNPANVQDTQRNPMQQAASPPALASGTVNPYTSRTDAFSAAGQARAASAQTVIPSAPARPTPTKSKVEIGLEGFCPVTLIEGDRWVRGDKRWGARHRGRVYLFHSAAAQQKFLSEPDRYSPALTGFDPVVFAEQGRYAAGMRAHGLRYHDQIFLFESEESLAKFTEQPNRFAQVVRLAVGANRQMIR